MGLESKRGLRRYLQAHKYRKAAKETLEFVKVFTETGHFISSPPLDASGVLTWKLPLLHSLASQRPSAQEERGDRRLDDARILARLGESKLLISPSDLGVAMGRIIL